MISDTSKHSSAEVKVFNDAILNDLATSVLVDKVTLWTDGADANFKNRFSMSIFSTSTNFESWNFFESYHGKGPHNSIGAAVKNFVWNKILAHSITIRNARFL